MNTSTSYQLISRDLAKALDRVEKQPLVDRDTDYYLENITKVKTVEEFVNNDRLFRYAMKAHGLEDMTYAKAFMIKALKEGVASPDAFANKLTDKRYAEFVTSFNFAARGVQATSYNRAQVDVPKNFGVQVELASLDPAYGHFAEETGNYIKNIGSITSIDGLMADNRLLTYAMAAYGLDFATETPAQIRSMLEGGVTSPSSPANQSVDKGWAKFVTAFNFVDFGASTTSRAVVKQQVTENYAGGTGMVLVEHNADYIKSESDYFKANISKIKTVSAFLSDSRLLSFAMAAHGLDASTETRKDVRKLLEGGVQDPGSFANMLSDPRYANFVAAFDFQQYGDQATSRDAAKVATTALWVGKAEVGFIPLSDSYIASETAFYKANISGIESIDDLIANKRLLSFALISVGLNASTEKPETIRKMLEGGITDASSPANKLTDKRYAALVTAFNFVEYGETTTTRSLSQRPVVDKFVRQVLEEDAGNENEGVRLALYFERKAPAITSFYEVLADPALGKVVRTLLSLPESFATADVDKQVQLFESKLKIKDFSDPEALGKLMSRFSTLWEVANPTQSQQAQVGILFGQPAEYSISTNLLLTMQGLKF